MEINIIIIIKDESWYRKDFDACIKSIFKETVFKFNLIFVVKKRINNNILKIIEEKKFKNVYNLKEAQKSIKNNITVVIKYPILFYRNWDLKIIQAIEKNGKKYNYVPSFINHFGEQLSILNKVYPDNILFDLDYKRDKMKKNNIDYFNTYCALQYKKINQPDQWIVIYANKKLKSRKTICVLSCAVAKLKR